MPQDLTPGQRRALFNIFERCETIKEATEEADLQDQFDELAREVSFAIDVGVTSDTLNKLRALLPPDLFDRFPMMTAA